MCDSPRRFACGRTGRSQTGLKRTPDSTDQHPAEGDLNDPDGEGHDRALALPLLQHAHGLQRGSAHARTHENNKHGRQTRDSDEDGASLDVMATIMNDVAHTPETEPRKIKTAARAAHVSSTLTHNRRGEQTTPEPRPGQHVAKRQTRQRRHGHLRRAANQHRPSAPHPDADSCARRTISEFVKYRWLVLSVLLGRGPIQYGQRPTAKQATHHSQTR
jgi:hypothetical protein